MESLNSIPNMELMMKQFNEKASRNVNPREKVDFSQKIKCTHPNCVKYAMYKYVSENSYLCWHHAYCHK